MRDNTVRTLSNSDIQIADAKDTAKMINRQKKEKKNTAFTRTIHCFIAVLRWEIDFDIREFTTILNTYQ